MSIWRHWFGNKTVLADEMAPLDETLGGFIAASLASADRVALDRDASQQRRVIAYFFGAIDALARANDLDETRAVPARVARA